MEDKVKNIIFIESFESVKRKINWEARKIIESSTTDLKDAIKPPQKYVPQKGDKLWFYPGCDIPRFKVKQFCLDNKVAVVKYKEKATVRFIGPEIFKTLIESKWAYYVEKKQFLDWLDTVICNAWIPLRDAITACPADRVYFNYYALNSFCGSNFGPKAIANSYTEFESQYIYMFNDEESYQHSMDLLVDPLVRHQDDLLSLLNTGTIMTEEMYDNIQRLFKSNDTENTKLAMEAMANCDFQKSAVYLLLLLKEYGMKMYNSGNKHHVNFKALLKYFQISNLTSISLDDILNSLRHQKLLSVDNLNMLMPQAMEQIKKQGEMQNIKIKDVELTPEMEQSIAENILDPQLEHSVEDAQSIPEEDIAQNLVDLDSHAALFAPSVHIDLSSI